MSSPPRPVASASFALSASSSSSMSTPGGVASSFPAAPSAVLFAASHTGTAATDGYYPSSSQSSQHSYQSSQSNASQSGLGLGVSGGRVQTVSFGEEMPAASGGGEAAWAANRRAEFGVVR
jgi:hypothetical protein